MDITSILTQLAEYRIVFVILLELLMISVVILLGNVIFKKIMADYKESHREENKETLKNADFSKMEHEKKGDALRRFVCSDAIDPGPNGYFIINDGGKDAYLRSFTISTMPKKTVFNKTFASLLDFPFCTSSIFINPISEQVMSNELDNHLNVLESEHIAAAGNTNRQRKLMGQYREAENWAELVEDGEEKFFDIGFVFTIFAGTIEDLNRLSDEFRARALDKSMNVTNCYAIQPEAYLNNMPLNRKVTIKSSIVRSDAIPFHRMDRASASTLFNYTEANYTHKNGVPLGRNLFTGKPFVFDVYDPAHDGFTVIIAGKTGSGKSVTIKVLCERYALMGYRFVAIDSQTRKGTFEGEYAALAEILNGVNFQISSRSNNVLNIFDVRETTLYIKNGTNSGYEKRTLELSDKIIQALNSIRTMMQIEDITDGLLNKRVDRIIKDTIAACYESLGIVNGDADSLYEIGSFVENGKLTNGRVAKKLPTITDFYKRLLIANRDNRDPSLNEAYQLIIMGMKDSVRELYYTAKTCQFLTREQYEALAFSSTREGVRVYKNASGDYEDAIAVRGIRPYFDGQSTLSIGNDCVFTNIDISQLVESERVVARQIAIDFVNENYIKKNSESLKASEKLLAIFDEAHENFKYEYARKTLENAVRTARKRNVGLLFCTQTIFEFSRYPETQDILKQAAVKMVCKQAPTDQKHLMDVLNITDTQSYLITNSIGCSEDDDEEYQNQHRGEMCVVDTSNVVFIKVDMFAETEALAAETSADGIKKLFKVS